MSYFSTSLNPIAGKYNPLSSEYEGDFESLLGLNAFTDLGKPLSYTTAAPADGPSKGMDSSAEAGEDMLSLNGVNLGPASKATFDQRLQLGLAQALLNKDDSAKDDERIRKFQQMMREEAIFANKMGVQNNLIGFALKDLPKAMSAPAWAGTTYNAQNAQGPYTAANARRYFT
jgi:hypothetical protein